MTMTYLVGDRKFSYSYSELQDRYVEFIAMDDDEFMKNVIDALHFACFVCFIKEISTEACLSDCGIVHELVHLIAEGTETPLTEIRESFNRVLKL